MNESIAKLIIENCHNDYLFERFTNEICGKEHNILSSCLLLQVGIGGGTEDLADLQEGLTVTFCARR